eukprot:TRINITY_DN60851_c0_g1_i1.p1 TRINITY_DN60851_c0_g1~~TRINITY_DN60851_c0_g1_i1.p1  ORF type:complete len:314 (+),score=76.10 TRINITY_DN60851_c0_g1_i1:139-1080(+)
MSDQDTATQIENTPDKDLQGSDEKPELIQAGASGSKRIKYSAMDHEMQDAQPPFPHDDAAPIVQPAWINSVARQVAKTTANEIEQRWNAQFQRIGADVKAVSTQVGSIKHEISQHSKSLEEHSKLIKELQERHLTASFARGSREPSEVSFASAGRSTTATTGGQFNPYVDIDDPEKLVLGGYHLDTPVSVMKLDIESKITRPYSVHTGHEYKLLELRCSEGYDKVCTFKLSNETTAQTKKDLAYHISQWLTKNKKITPDRFQTSGPRPGADDGFDGLHWLTVHKTRAKRESGKPINTALSALHKIREARGLPD